MRIDTAIRITRAMLEANADPRNTLHGTLSADRVQAIETIMNALTEPEKEKQPKDS